MATCYSGSIADFDGFAPKYLRDFESARAQTLSQAMSQNVIMVMAADFLALPDCVHAVKVTCRTVIMHPGILHLSLSSTCIRRDHILIAFQIKVN